MTKEASPTELTDSELDTAAGGLNPKMTDVMISSYNTSGSTESPPADQISIGYTVIKQSYKRNT
jgi:hypothetical protein